MKPTDNTSRSRDEGDDKSQSGVPASISHDVGQSHDDPLSMAVRADMHACPFGWRVDLQPMRAFDALRIWSKLGARPEASSLLFDVRVQSAVDRSGEMARLSSETRTQPTAGERFSLAALAEQLSIGSRDRFDDEQLVLDSMPLRELIGMIDQAHLRCVLVDGPIELRDAHAMRKAIEAGRSPLDVELRAEASLEVCNDRHVCLHVREKKNALQLIAESFRVYLGSLRNRPVDEIAPPHTFQIERLMDISGSISFRPVETDLFSTFVDVGISTHAEPFSTPANCSLIYDIPSNTWHDER